MNANLITKYLYIFTVTINLMTTSIIIPARYGSSRYRGKPLVKILGKEMVIRVADICSKIKNVNVLNQIIHLRKF